MGEITDSVISVLNSKKKNIVYMLWGKYAQSKGSFIDKAKNLVLSSGHPSPFSANAILWQITTSANVISI